MRLSLATLIGACALAGLADQASAQDAERGEVVFRRCGVCHRIGEGAKNMAGPVLNNVVGRNAGTVEGYSYSALNKAAGEAGLTWTDANLAEYLADPNVFLKKFLTEHGKPELAIGSTKMILRLPSEDERKDVIAYLNKFTSGSN